MTFPRQSGILLHPTSFPGNFGIGDFGADAFRFIDFLENAKQTLWQILPFGQTGYGDSPYQAFSAFAGNLYLISPQELAKDGLLSNSDLENVPDFPAKKVDYGAMISYKVPLLRRAFENFRKTSDQKLAQEFRDFCQENDLWLNDYALFRAIKLSKNQTSWQSWEQLTKLRDPDTLAKLRLQLDTEDFAQKFYQFCFFRQWSALKSYANQKGIQIIGDIPIFLALDSADVWCRPEQFKLNADGSPKVVAGVPPDYFSKTGQLWGNPIYNWNLMRDGGFRWWIDRVRHNLKHLDILRIDHFRGFAASWEVPGMDQTAENGAWVDVPGKDLFNTLKWVFGELPILAEDLGVVTPDVVELRDTFGFPGMKILQYAFGGDATNGDLPHNYPKNCCVYPGTHDNETTIGWYKTKRGRHPKNESANIRRELQYCHDYLQSNGREINWDFIRVALASVANTAIIPLQDVLGLGNEARLNAPSTTDGNWQWRYSTDDLTNELAEKLAALTERYGR